MRYAAWSTARQPPNAAAHSAHVGRAPGAETDAARGAAQSVRATADIAQLRGGELARAAVRGARLGCAVACLVGTLLGAACGSEAPPWTGFSTFDLDAGAIDFGGSLRPRTTGTRRGVDTAGAGTGAPTAPEIGAGAATDRDASASTAGDAGIPTSDAGDAMGGDASDLADAAMGGSAGARTDDGRRRGPFGGWDGGGWFGRGEGALAGRGGEPARGEDAADADDAGSPR